MSGQSSLARRLEHTRRRARAAAETAERRMVIAGSAAGIGFLEKKSFVPVSIAGIPTKLGLGILATLGEANTSGASRRMLGAIADASLAIYGYQAVKTASFIAGDDDDSVGEELS